MSEQSDVDALREFVQADPIKHHKRRCWVCSIPERAAIDIIRREGGHAAQIKRFLEEKKGYVNVNKTCLHYHFYAGHHLE